jgi:hypothetical protein
MSVTRCEEQISKFGDKSCSISKEVCLPRTAVSADDVFQPEPETRTSDREAMDSPENTGEILDIKDFDFVTMKNLIYFLHTGQVNLQMTAFDCRIQPAIRTLWILSRCIAPRSCISCQLLRIDVTDILYRRVHPKMFAIGCWEIRTAIITRSFEGRTLTTWFETLTPSRLRRPGKNCTAI